MSDEPVEPSLDDETERVARAIELRDQGHEDWLERASEGDPGRRQQILEAVQATEALHEYFVEGLARDARIDTRLDDRYRLVERLGAGAMGVVYAAQDAVLEREVAVKVLRHGLIDPDRSLKRFEREARALAAVVHSSVVGIHDRGLTDEGESYLVMERLQGASLQSLVEGLSDSGVSPAEVSTADLARQWGIELRSDEGYVRTCVRWIAELADGIASAHDAGVVHRDIKPSNVFIRANGHAALLDFGIARFVDAEALTDHDSSLGTPAFIAPECIRDRDGASTRSDVYGLAAVLYSLLALRPPFIGVPMQVLLDAVTQEPDPLRRWHPGIAIDLVAIVEKGMERDPGRRYASARDLRADLLAFLEHRPVQARPIGPLGRQLRRLRRSRAAQAVLGSIAVVALGGVWLGVDSSLRLARQGAWEEAWRQLPPNFAIVRPENRFVLGQDDRQRLAGGLDRLVSSGVEPLYSRLLRASFRLDHGDVDGAAADMLAIADRVDSPLSHALAVSYAKLEPGASGSAALELSELPAPSGQRDRLLRAWHHLRAFEDPQAEALLDEALLETQPLAEELRFALVGFAGLEPVQRRARALQLEADVRRFEQRNVGRTATTAHFLAFARGHINDYRGSLALARESIALAPRSHTNRTNAAHSAFALGLIDESREHLDVALELRPNDFKPARTLVWTFIAEGDHDGAHAALERFGSALEARIPGWSKEFALTIETYRALTLWSTARDEQRDPGADVALAETLDAARGFA
ncbi:MAG: serine/threonine-protein kinase, partial [Planctomycetota bacterium]